MTLPTDDTLGRLVTETGHHPAALTQILRLLDVLREISENRAGAGAWREQLVPLKLVLHMCNVSRATLWRVSRADKKAFPSGIRRAGRLYWRSEDIASIQIAIEKFYCGGTVRKKRRKLG